MAANDTNEKVYLSKKVVVGCEFEFIRAYQMVVDTPKMLNCLKACYNLHTFLVVRLLLHEIPEIEKE